MSGFSVDWLDLREEADRRARDAGLLEKAMAWLEAGQSAAASPVVLDLGAGTGATLRALCSRPGHDRLTPAWRLVDHDQQLLAEARRRHGGSHRIETFPADLAQVSRLPLAGARLVTASALFDLVSAQFMAALATALQDECKRAPAGVYAALNYDGTTRWSPAHPLDDAVLQVFNRDQCRDKGMGPALGPGAGRCMEKVFSGAGFQVHAAGSPWILDGKDAGLLGALIDGISNAVAGQSALDPQALADWTRYRKRHVTSGTCTVGHTDLLAIPYTA